MTNFNSGDHGLILYVLDAGAWFSIGAAICALHFLTLRRNIRMFAADRSLVLAFATQLVRFALIAGMPGVIAIHFGTTPLLITTAGILVTQTAFIRWGMQS